MNWDRLISISIIDCSFKAQMFRKGMRGQALDVGRLAFALNAGQAKAEISIDRLYLNSRLRSGI